MELHPLEPLVLNMLREHKYVDVFDVTLYLAGPPSWFCLYTARRRAACRIVAAGVLEHMTSAGRLATASGETPDDFEKGGVDFCLPAVGRLAAQPPTPRLKKGAL